MSRGVHGVSSDWESCVWSERILLYLHLEVFFPLFELNVPLASMSRKAVLNFLVIRHRKNGKVSQHIFSSSSSSCPCRTSACLLLIMLIIQWAKWWHKLKTTVCLIYHYSPVIYHLLWDINHFVQAILEDLFTTCCHLYTHTGWQQEADSALQVWLGPSFNYHLFKPSLSNQADPTVM